MISRCVVTPPVVWDQNQLVASQCGVLLLSRHVVMSEPAAVLSIFSVLGKSWEKCTLLSVFSVWGVIPDKYVPLETYPMMHGRQMGTEAPKQARQF